MSAPKIDQHVPPQSFPFILRILNSKVDWGDATDPPIKPSDIAQKVFEGPDCGNSVYHVSNYDQFRRVIVAWKANGMHVDGTTVYTTFSQSELEACNFKIDKTPGDVDCHEARDLHRELYGTWSQFEQLVSIAKSANRDAGKVTKGQQKAHVKAAKQENCHALGECDRTLPCRVSTCPGNIPN